MKVELYRVISPAILDQSAGEFVAYLDYERDLNTVYIGVSNSNNMPERPLVMYKKQDFTEQNLHNYVRIYIETAIKLKTEILGSLKI